MGPELLERDDTLHRDQFLIADYQWTVKGESLKALDNGATISARAAAS